MPILVKKTQQSTQIDLSLLCFCCLSCTKAWW